MRFWIIFAVCLSFLTAAQTARANPDIKAVIQSQIEAFQKDDFETAFDYASPAIQRIFGDPVRFGAMVRKGYPMVWRPTRVEFGALQESERGLEQEVILEDSAGRVFRAFYEMVQLNDAWRINAVRIIQGLAPTV